MTKKEYMLKRYYDFYEGYTARKMEFYNHPSTARMEPFKITDNLYYVGDRKVCIHLIDTGEGLILIDSGYIGAAHLLVDSIWRIGFDPCDIKIILHTHGHTDHYGASNEFARMYGCKLAISRIDADLVSKSAVNGCIGGSLHPLAKAPVFDIMLEDGDIVELGNTKIRCVLSPGHTEGVLSFFFDTAYQGKTYSVGLFGGAGTNALTLPYLYKNGYPEDLPCTMLKTIDMLKSFSVDIHLGNHPSNNRTIEKRMHQMQCGGNPFIDKSSWTEFLESLENKVMRIIDENKELSSKADICCDE